MIAQIELFGHRDFYERKVYTLPKHLDEEVARLHLDKLGVKLTTPHRGPGRLPRHPRRRAPTSPSTTATSCPLSAPAAPGRSGHAWLLRRVPAPRSALAARSRRLRRRAARRPLLRRVPAPVARLWLPALGACGAGPLGPRLAAAQGTCAAVARLWLPALGACGAGPLGPRLAAAQGTCAAVARLWLPALGACGAGLRRRRGSAATIARSASTPMRMRSKCSSARDRVRSMLATVLRVQLIRRSMRGPASCRAETAGRPPVRLRCACSRPGVSLVTV